MRIALVASSYYPRIGGVETHVRRLAHGFAEAGEQVTVITHQFGDARAEEWDGKVRLLRFPLAARSRNYPVSPAMFRYLKSHATDFDVQLPQRPQAVDGLQLQGGHGAIVAPLQHHQVQDADVGPLD